MVKEHDDEAEDEETTSALANGSDLDCQLLIQLVHMSQQGGFHDAGRRLDRRKKRNMHSQKREANLDSRESKHAVS